MLVVVEGFVQLVHISLNALVAEVRLSQIGELARSSPLDLRIEVLAVGAARVEPCVGATNDLHVLLRHRPRSISRQGRVFKGPSRAAASRVLGDLLQRSCSSPSANFQMPSETGARAGRAPFRLPAGPRPGFDPPPAAGAATDEEAGSPRSAVLRRCRRLPRWSSQLPLGWVTLSLNPVRGLALPDWPASMRQREIARQGDGGQRHRAA